MFEDAIEILSLIGVAVFMSGVAGSPQQIAEDLRVLAGRHDPKPPAEAPVRLIDA